MDAESRADLTKVLADPLHRVIDPETEKQSKGRLVWSFTRDLCVMLEPELAGKWSGDLLKALERVRPGVFDKVVRGHNPLYFCAEKIWFANLVLDPNDMKMKPASVVMLQEELHKKQMSDEIVDYLTCPDELRGSGLIKLVQRDAFKSTWNHGVTVDFYAFRMKEMFGLDTRILLEHQRESQASKNLIKIRHKHVRPKSAGGDPGMDFLTRYWPEFTAEEEFGTKTEFNWPCRIPGVLHEPSVMASGLGQAIVGMHFDLKLSSDLVDRTHRKSAAVRNEAMDNYQAKRYTLDSIRGREILDGTRYHLQDLYGRNLSMSDEDGNPMYRRIIIGAGGEGTGKPLSFPKRHTQKYLDRIRQEEVERSGNDDYWWLQQQNEPRFDRSKIVDASMIRRIDLARIPAGLATVVLCDPAWKGDKNSQEGCDASIGALALERRGPVLLAYLLDLVVSDELTKKDGEKIILQMCHRWGTVDVGIEERGGYGMRTDLVDRGMERKPVVPVACIDLKTMSRKKEDRITSFLVFIQSGRFYVSEECRNLDALYEQVTDWPQSDKIDILDMLGWLADPEVQILAGETEDYDMDNLVPFRPQRRTLHTRV